VIRITEEDRELEMFVAEGEADIAVPFEVSRDIRGDLSLTVYPSCRYLAEQFSEMFAEDPFSSGAEVFLKNGLVGRMGAWGYQYDPQASEVILLYEATSNSRREREAAVLLKSGEELPSLLTFQPQSEEEDPMSFCAVVIVDGKIVSAAQVNDLSFDGDLPEINVETAVGYRGQGYAASCTRVLTCELLKYYPRVLYSLRERNKASAAVAEKAGFHKMGERKAFVCYRKD